LRILGIDPGLAITGYGVIDVQAGGIKLKEAGIIRTSYREKLQDRLIKIYDGLNQIINETNPDIGVIEKLYSHYKHPTTAILMGHVRGVIYLAVRKNKISLFEYPAKRIKKAVVGRGDATKEQVGRMVQGYLNLKSAPSPPDVTDALALAIAHTYIIKGQEGIR